MKTKVMLLCCFVLLTISCSQKKIALFNGQDLQSGRCQPDIHLF